MSQFTPVDGNPSETVGGTRLLAAEESETTLRLRSVPRTSIEVLSEYLTGTYVLIGIIVALGLEALLAIALDPLFTSDNLGIVIGGLAALTLVVGSVVFFTAVHRSADDRESSIEERGSMTLSVEAEGFEVTSEGWLGRRTRLTGSSWELLETLRRLNRGRITISTSLVATLWPTGSIQSYLVAAMSDRDRQWLERQLDT